MVGKKISIMKSLRMIAWPMLRSEQMNFRNDNVFISAHLPVGAFYRYPKLNGLGPHWSVHARSTGSIRPAKDSDHLRCRLSAFPSSRISYLPPRLTAGSQYRDQPTVGQFHHPRDQSKTLSAILGRGPCVGRRRQDRRER